MIERTSRPMTAEERAACDPTPGRLRQRRTRMRSMWIWMVIALVPFLIGGNLFFWTFLNTKVDDSTPIVGFVVAAIAVVPFLVGLMRLSEASSVKDDKRLRVAFDRATVETWILTIDRAWWNGPDDDYGTRLLRATNGRYVFLGTYEWLDIPKGNDVLRPMCPSRLQVVDDGVNFSLTALEGPMIPLESVPDELPREVYDLPHFEVVVYDASSLPAWLRRLVEPGVQ